MKITSTNISNHCPLIKKLKELCPVCKNTEIESGDIICGTCFNRAVKAREKHQKVQRGTQDRHTWTVRDGETLFPLEEYERD
jgi:uncharacterized Zn finger protein (UPF0148 family)